ncbi:DUF1877 family protein [Micromonospora auratinigra]|uniref:DUF1877 domain-containing protein n=1 Tax=Micromonospora auratinigra TaxID=261654 RepID=A0A1A8ZDX7_9ACTN|nr:DUF1877 family protein [Micromonospora auratinigra]SBT42087.1 protein of unknown function (DUF1877) [Micromonospora auratinigra]
MSFHMHLRATAPNDVPEDYSSLRDFMWVAWEAHPEEYAAGIADSIDKDFGRVDELYTKGVDRGDATSAASTLPIFGGRHVHSPTKDQPPFVILNPAEVRGVAEFLRTVSFDERWEIAGTHDGWEDENRSTFLDYHNDLRTFYQRAAQAGHAVIKAFRY